MFQLNQNAPSSKLNCACSSSLQIFVHSAPSTWNPPLTRSLPFLTPTDPGVLILYFFRSLSLGTPKLPCGFPMDYLIATYFSNNQLVLCYNQLSAYSVISPTRQFLYFRYRCIPISQPNTCHKADIPNIYYWRNISESV